jgi:hypothetical protein
LLGVARCIKYSAHFGPNADGDEGIALIEEGLAAPGVPPPTEGLARMLLGQALLRRGLTSFQAPEILMTVIAHGAPPGTLADVDGAVGHLRTVAATTAFPQMAAGAAKMVRMGEALRSLVTTFGTPSLGVQMDVLARSLATFQELEREGLRFQGMPDVSVFDTEWTARMDPTDFPVAVFRDAEPQERRPPRERPPVTADVDALRVGIGELFGGVDDVFSAAASLLDVPEPPTWIDDFVTAATTVVHSAQPPTGIDHFLLAVALYLRGRRDDGGWDPADGVLAGDAHAAVDSLLAAARDLADSAPDRLPVLVRLAAELPDSALEDLGAALGDFAVMLRAAGVEAIYLPEPAASLRWNVSVERFEPSETRCDADQAVTIIGDGAQPVGGTGAFPGQPGVDDDVAVSYVSSLSQLRTLSKRTIRPVGQDPVFVANPRGDRVSAAMETMLLRRNFYPRSAGFGGLLEAADGPGSSEEVRSRLDASLLFLACGVTEKGVLELAGSTELDLAGLEVTPGGLAFLPPDHFQPLADLLLKAGFTGVVGWRSPVPEAVAAAAAYVIHAELADGVAPAQAVRVARRWLAAPDASQLPALLASSVEQSVGSEARAAIVYWGR